MISVIGKKEIIFTVIEDNCFKESTVKIPLDVFKSSIDNKDVRFLCCEKNFGDLIFTDLKESEQQEISKKRQYLDALVKSSITTITEKNIKDTISSVALSRGEKPPHWQTVRNWWNNYKDAGFKSKGLFPSHRYKGNKVDRLNKKVIEIINGLANEYYSENKISMKSIDRSVRSQINDYKIKNPSSTITIPTYKAIRDRILNVPYEKQQIKREGKNTTKAKTAYKRNVIQSDFVLDRVEMDHTPMDIHVVYDDKKTLAGRPNLTVLIDHHSHMLLGFMMSFVPPSTAVLSAACLNAFIPKTIHKELGIKYDWPAKGIPKTLVTDNGNEFWSASFATTANEIGFPVQYCPVKKANYKGRCERFFGKMNSMFLDNLPGVVRKPNKCGEKYDAAQEATLTFTELKERFLLWVTGVYHNLPLDHKNMATPNELWAESEEMLPIIEEDENELRLHLLSTWYPTLGKNGVQRKNEEYCNRALRDLYRRDGGGKVTGKYSPLDLGMVYILDEKNQKYIPVENREHEARKGVSEHEAKMIRARANEIKADKLTNEDLVSAEIQLEQERQADHERNKRRKKQKTTSKSARIEGVGGVDVMPKTECKKSQSMKSSGGRKRRVHKTWAPE